jgi:hypothetical protein
VGQTLKRAPNTIWWIDVDQRDELKISLVRYGMSKPWVIEDELRDRIESLLPPWPDKAPGPRPIPDRLCLQGILFELHTGIGWEDLPQELGFGSGMTC